MSDCGMWYCDVYCDLMHVVYIFLGMCPIVGLYRWSHDQNFREKASRCKGIRLLRQPTLETLVAFICSSNNNIPRISGMVTRYSII